MVTGGRNMGRVGVITHRERHDGGFNIVHIKDAVENSFATRETNVFVIGSEKPWISLPKGKGVKVCIHENLVGSIMTSQSCLSPKSEIVAVRMHWQVIRLVWARKSRNRDYYRGDKCRLLFQATFGIAASKLGRQT